MAYSTGWTAEAKKAHGEALAARVYCRRVSPVTITNYYDPSTGRMRPTINSGNGWQFGEDVTYSPVVASQPVYKFAGTGATQMWIDYKMNDAELQTANKVLFSAYIHSGSATVGYLGMFPALSIVSYTGASSALEDTALIRLNDDGADGFTVASTGGTSYTSGGVETVGGGWSRVWMLVTQPDANRATREYTFKMIADRPASTSVYSYTYMSAPMIETNVTSPSVFTYRSQIVNHPSELEELASYEKAININPLLRKRERDYGVAQGQQVQLELSDVDRDKMYRSGSTLMNAWVAIQFGFPTNDLWETVFQGRIVNAVADTNLKLVLEIDESIMKLLEEKTKRDMYFGLTPWISEVKTITKATTSAAYSNVSGGVSYTTSLSGNVRDETYTVAFDSSTSYRIYNEFGVALLDNTKNFDISGTVFTTGASASFSPAHYTVTGQNVLTLSKDGWTGVHVSGDTFAFTTSAARTPTELTPLGMIKHLVKDVAGITVYDVMNGIYYDSPFYDETFFANKASVSIGSIGGEWKAGSRVIEMVQDALKMEHMSIYPSENGQIHIWALSDFKTGATLVNGDPTNNDVNLIAGSVTDTLEDYANIVVVNYLDADTGEEVSTKVEYPNKSAAPVEMTIDTKWRVQDNVALTAGSRALYRFSNTKRQYNLDTSLALADVNLTEPVSVYDTFLGAYNDKVIVVERALDLNNQSIKLVAWNDPLASINVARIDYTTVGNTEQTVW